MCSSVHVAHSFLSFFPLFFLFFFSRACAVYLNYRRKSVSGLSPDFQVLNLLGFSCYAIYNAGLFWSPTVRREYASRHGGEAPAVHLNDVFFGAHALLITAATLSQFFLYDAHTPGEAAGSVARPGDDPAQPAPWADEGEAAWVEAEAEAAARAGGRAARFESSESVAALPSTPLPRSSAPGWSLRRGRVLLRSSAAAALVVAGAAVLAAAALSAAPSAPFPLTWLGLLYALSFVKLGVTLTKYVPQALLNHRLRSTIGWNIWAVALDAEGGLLSIFQELLDCQARGDWSPVLGNPAKFGLGFVSLGFDAVFFAQHVIYARQTEDAQDDDRAAKEPFLPPNEP